MDKYECLSHTKWERKYHVVFIRSVVEGRCTSSYVSTWGKCHGLARQKQNRVEGHLMPDHMHMMLAIPPKYVVSQVMEPEGEERDPSGAGVRGEEEKLCGATLLGKRLLCVDGGAR